MSLYEANEIPTAGTKEHILKFISDYSAYFVGDKRKDDVKTLSGEVMETGIKKKDATHLACAIFAECDYFITTDKRVTNYATHKIKIVNPIDFIKIWREM
jgi:predicted nucleic acid-binding protein